MGWNTSRSPTDKRHAALWYPKTRTQQVITQLLDDLACAAETQLTGERQARTTGPRVRPHTLCTLKTLQGASLRRG